MRLVAALLLLLALPVGAATNAPPVSVDEPTEAVIQGALKYLASKQAPNGSWSPSNRPTAMTGYTLMAFLSAGNLPGEGPYGKTVANGVQFLLDSVQPDGMFAPTKDGQYMYGHGIATIALAEVYGQTRAKNIRPKLEQLVQLIVRSQNKKGGWQYRPTAQEADISVTVLQVVALRAAKNAGLDVPAKTITQAVSFVQQCYHAQSGGFGYQPHSGPGFARTAAAIYSLQVCGVYNDPHVQTGAEYLFGEPSRHDKEWFTYGHFYAGPAMYMIGGTTWEQWYQNVKKLLLQHVVRDGELVHWEPVLDVGATKWLGPLYCTAVYTTILAIPYHYIPLYQR